MNRRIWAVCRHYLYKHLADTNKLVESDDNCIRLRTIERAKKLNSLLSGIVRQLQDDVALDPQIRNMKGLWEDKSFEIKLLAELYSGFHELEVGVPREIAGKWKDLEKLEPRWAFPPSSIPRAGDKIPRDRRGGSDHAKQDHETREKVKRLIASHVEPDFVAAQVSTATPETQNQREPEDAQGDTKVGLESSTPFEVQHRGKGQSKNMFNRPSEQLASDSSSSVPVRESTTRKNMAPWVDNICPDCGVEVEPGKLRAEHKSKCMAKCDRCEQEGLVCRLRPKGKDSDECQECFDKSLECIRSDIAEKNLYGSGKCSNCGEWKRQIKRHEKTCKTKKICEDCGRKFTQGSLSRHKKTNCKGRCTNCRNQGSMTPCERQTASKGPCVGCVERGEEETCDAAWMK